MANRRHPGLRPGQPPHVPLSALSPAAQRGGRVAAAFSRIPAGGACRAGQVGILDEVD
jgi:hypothetical protein